MMGRKKSKIVTDIVLIQMLHLARKFSTKSNVKLTKEFFLKNKGKNVEFTFPLNLTTTPKDFGYPRFRITESRFKIIQHFFEHTEPDKDHLFKGAQGTFLNGMNGEGKSSLVALLFAIALENDCYTLYIVLYGTFLPTAKWRILCGLLVHRKRERTK